MNVDANDEWKEWCANGGRVGGHLYNIRVTSVTWDCACGCRMGPTASWKPATPTGKPCTCDSTPNGYHRKDCPSEVQVDPWGDCPIHGPAPAPDWFEYEEDPAPQRRVELSMEED